MKCPYCNDDMDKGVIVGDRAGLDFIADKAEKRLMIFSKRIKLKGFWDDNLIAYYCKKCCKIIIDINNS